MSLTLPGTGPMTLPSGSLLAVSPATGNRTDLVATMKKFADEFGSLMETNGWQKLASGLIIQWGKSTGVSGNNVITFPIAFPNACLFTMASVDAELSSVGDTSRTSITNGKTTTTATFYGGQTESNGAAAGPFNWFAIGY